MDAATGKHIQWIATEIDDLSLLLRVQGLDRVANMLDEAIDALQPMYSDPPTLSLVKGRSSTFGFRRKANVR